MSINNQLLNELIDINKIKDFLKVIIDEKVEEVKSMLVLFEKDNRKIIFEVMINKTIKKIECFSEVIEIGG